MGSEVQGSLKQIDIFENIPLFSGLNDDERDILRKVAVKRLRGADKKIESLALNDVYRRIARLFVNLAKPV